jgi:transposase-like protein
MGRKKAYRYSAEFKAEAVRLHQQSGKSLSESARDIGVSAKSLRSWVAQAEIDAGNGPEGALTSSEREELAKLRRELRQVKMERDFLKKVSAFFARESS